MLITNYIGNTGSRKGTNIVLVISGNYSIICRISVTIPRSNYNYYILESRETR